MSRTLSNGPGHSSLRYERPILSGGVRRHPLRALLRAFEDEFRIAASESPLEELARVMEYERLPFTDADREEFLTILRREADIVAPDENISEIDRDPSDNRFLECALASDADVIVSGDEHLLELEEFRDIEICTPAAFLDTRG